MGKMKEYFMEQREKKLESMPIPQQEPVIVSARITDMPKDFLDPMPQVYVKLEDGTEEFLFEYYPDEISFSPSEFKGLTIAEAKHLKFKKDKNYLQS
jgi:hypothetical protein